MNPEIPEQPAEDLEYLLTAYLLGELDADDVAKVEAELARNPALRKLRSELEFTMGLVRDVVRNPAESEPNPSLSDRPQLSNPRRTELLESLRQAPVLSWPKADGQRDSRRWMIPMAIAASLVGILSLHEFNQPAAAPRSERIPFARDKAAEQESIAPGDATLNGRVDAQRSMVELKVEERSGLTPDSPKDSIPRPTDLSDVYEPNNGVFGGLSVGRRGNLSGAAPNLVYTPPAKGELAPSSYATTVAGAADALESRAAQSVERFGTVDLATPALKAPKFPTPTPAPATPVESLQRGSVPEEKTVEESLVADLGLAEARSRNKLKRESTAAMSFAEQQLGETVDQHPLIIAAKEAPTSQLGFQFGTQVTPTVSATNSSLSLSRRFLKTSPSATEQESRPELSKAKASTKELAEGKTRWDAKAIANPQPEILTSENAVSTFSLNVSDVSFKLATASLQAGSLPDPTTVRTEEFINAFQYRDPEPASGQPMAFAWDRAASPFEQNRELLRFSIKTAATGRELGRPLNLVLLLDKSGSMERPDRVQMVKEALISLSNQLSPRDQLSVVVFARTPRLLTEAMSSDAEQVKALARRISEIPAEGGTNLEEAMKLAYTTASKHFLRDGLNRVVLLTDGAANLGDVEPLSLRSLVESWRQRGVALDCFGVGWEGLNDSLLATMASHGDGRYGLINTPEDADNSFATQLAGALQVAASDVKVQVEFNPQRVSAWRQLGYATHQLTREQFRDNKVDAAELAATEAGNALYAIQVTAQGSGPIGIVRARFRDPISNVTRELSWSVPYTGSAASLETSAPRMRLATSAGLFGEWLSQSPHAGEVTPTRLLKILSGVPAALAPDTRPALLESLIQQAQILTGK